MNIESLDAPVRIAARDQRIVSDPALSAWVDASAGSGKTKVLTDRALRLMLEHGRPERILCLTFTKAAAAEMTHRIVKALADWATGPERTLRDRLQTLTGAAPDPETLVRARSLFARVVDAPGGLKVQTVHAFCQSALERFPVEAGAPPAFAALDERAAADLMTEARDRVLRDVMGTDADPALVEALDRMAERGGVERLDAALQALLAERGRLAALGDVEAAVAALLRATGFRDAADAAGAARALAAPPAETAADLKRLAEAWLEGSKTDRDRGEPLAAWLARDADARAGDFAPLFDGFYAKSTGDRRANAATKGVLNANAWFQAAHDRAIEWVENARDRVRRADVALDSIAAVRLADAVGARYAALKATRAALDFDDLILKMRDLLARDGGAGWALYKLDQGVDHILVDEAQDTNPEQWQVVHALAAEFFQDGAEHRTLFAVGDPKQSIFSFQRADPAEFARARDRFRDAAVAVGQRFEEKPLAVSFRSVPAILDVVDKVFAEAPGLPGLTPDGMPPEHRAARQGLPGRVELWPLAPKPETPKRDPWAPARTYPDAGQSGEAQVAQMVAAKIRALIDDPAERVSHGAEQPGGRRIVAGDFMVIVQRRGRFGDLLARELKRLGVPTAGVDRMRLSRQLAVRDLLALGQVAVLPEDDLALACFLKSPLVGLTEAGLFELAHGRGRTPLWRRLKHAAAADPAGAAARGWDWVREAMARADYAPPFDFYQWALGPRQGRARLAAAMGDAVLDPLDEFLALALRYAAERPSSLSGFLAWMERDSVEIKRELEGGAGGVRLLTAHAAKGLQAPIVFLPDTTSSPPTDRLRLYWPETPAGRAPLLAGRKADDPAMVAALAAEREAAAAAERRRLLYVAMTRAEDRLYVAGWQTGSAQDGRTEGCWHELVESGLDRLRGVEPTAVDYADQPVLAYVDGGRAPDAAAPAPAEATEADHAFELPDWFDRPAPPPEGAPVAGPTVAPSRVVDEADDPPAALSPLARQGVAAAAARRFGRGLLIHRLLERLPGLSPEARAEVGRAYVGRAANLSPAEAEATLAAVLRLIDDPAFGQAFDPAALAEAPIAGEIGGRRYAGVIDRLVIAPESVTIVDFKTNRPPPAGPEATPPAYLAQLALYRALARQAFPGRAVRLALLWTEAPRLDRLDDRLLDAFAPDG